MKKMRKIRLFIATSIDGYIAKPDGNLDWLTSQPQPKEGDYGYMELIGSVDTIIMGRSTYDHLLGYGEDWFYPEHDTLVFSRNPEFQPRTPRTFAIHASNAQTEIDALRAKEGKDIWLVGGGELVAKFLHEGWIDEMLITIVPVVLGDGIRLFPSAIAGSDWRLEDVERFETGLLNLRYGRA
jgi:dihydrofolate reductase